MPRCLLIVILAVGLVLAACAPPESAGKSGNKQQAEKPAKEEPQSNEKVQDQEWPKPETDRDGGKNTKSKEQKKPARGPKPAPSKPKPAPSPANAQESPRSYDATVTVSRVVDGDTIEISPAGGNEEVRLIGMDAPETKDPSEGVEPLGPEASAFATEELEGQSVGLEFDVEREDQYGRLLAYVYLGGEMFNEVLVEEGYAQAYPYEPNTRYEERFAAAQEEARAVGLGIWGLTLVQQCQLADRGNGIGEGTPGCSGVSVSASASASAFASASSSAAANPSAGGAVPPISEDYCPPGAPIKGNQSSGIYHVPGGAYYDVTDPEECFATPQDAQAAGYRASEM